MDRGYTKSELIDAARAAGHHLNEKLVDRWVGAGLLDQAHARSRGRGRGVARWWPESQCRLFLSLLDKHRTARDLTALANLPVIVWAIWGEEFVPLRQVRRALETYARIDPRRKPFRGQAWARRLVTKIARPGTSGHQRDALADALLRALRAGRPDDPELARRFEDVVGPADLAAQADGPRIMSLIEAQWAGRARFAEFTDGHYQWARAFFLYSQEDYSRTRPFLAADPRFGRLHQPFTFQTIANEACHSIMLILGLSMILPEPSVMPEQLRLAPWLEDRAHLVTHVTEYGAADLVTGLGIEVEVTIDPPTSTERSQAPT